MHPKRNSRVIALSEHELIAVKAFNSRMRAAGAPGDFVQECVRQHGDPASIRNVQEIVWDGADVHGGVLRLAFPGWWNGSAQTVVNFQSPISEGIIDKQHAMVGMLLVRHMQQSGSAFIVGMGGFENALPKLLKASGWRVQAVPFFFRVHRPNRFLRELPLFRQSTRLNALSLAARATGLGWAGIMALHWKSAKASLVTTGCSLHPLDHWPDWTDSVWEEFRQRCSFAVSRDRRSLEWLYPGSDRRLLRFALRAGGSNVGWVACLRTEMREHGNFGNLCVGTILDGLAPRQYARALLHLADRELGTRGCDVVISNQTHHSFVEALRECGFMSRSSNYLFACTKPLAAVIEQDGAEKIHVTRGDGDGRINL